MAELYGISGGLQVFYGAMKNEYEMVYDDTEEACGGFQVCFGDGIGSVKWDMKKTATDRASPGRIY